MFPKNSQKKNTVVLMIDGKGPQTIPTMDTPPEPKKVPRCRLVMILVVLLLISLILLAGYCAWLFFSFTPSPHMTVPDSLGYAEGFAATSPAPPRQGHGRSSTSAPLDLNEDVISLSSRTKGEDDSGDSREDFLFVSSFEDVYDSSEPYGSSHPSYDSSSSFSIDVDYEYSSSGSVDTSSGDTTRKEDGYLLQDTEGISPFERIKLLLSNIADNGQTLPGRPLKSPSYEVMSSYWFARDSERDSSGGGGGNSWGNVFASDYSLQDIDEDDSSGDWESLSFSDTTDDLILDLFSDASLYLETGSGSGDDDWSDDYDQLGGDRIPRPMTSPPAIDQLPPERIEISVCSWPKRLLDQDANAIYDGEMKYAMNSRPDYDVLGLSMNNVSITQMISERGGSTTAKIFMRDYLNSIVAVRYSVTTSTASASNCYFSFLTPDLEEDILMDQREMEGSGDLEDDYLQEFTLEIRNPVLLGGNLPLFNEPITDLCDSSKKYWATSIHVKQ